MNKFTLLIYLLFWCSLNINSQDNIIQGKIINNNGLPLEFANVTLHSLPDSALITGTITDNNGAFTLTAKKIANNFLKISFIGYKTRYLTDESRQTITLQENDANLGEVSIKVIRPKVTFKNDRFDIKIENSLAAKGNTIESLLQQLPGVWVTSDGGILINGLSGVQVIIDDRPIRLSGASLMRYLSSFRSENISRIEVIQRPSAMYEAEGNGIIRIITKKNIDEGISGTISTKTDIQRFAGISPFLSLQYYKGDFGANVSLNGEKSKWLLLSNNYAKDIQQEIEYETELKDTIFDKNYSLNVDLFYKINRKNNIAFNVNYLYWAKDECITGETNINGENKSAIWQTVIDQKDLQNMNIYSFTVNYDLLLDSTGTKKITFLSDYVNQYKYNSKSYYNYHNYDLQDNLILTEDILNDQESPFQMLSTEINYHHSVTSKSILTTGIKYSNSFVNNILTSYEELSDECIIDNSIGYKYEYNEKLISTFIQYNISKTRWSFIGGLRGEYTFSQIENVRSTEEKSNLFPSFYFNYNLNDKNKLGFSYTQRIQRINYLQLLPKRYYTSRYNIVEGNPLLSPNIINNIGINYNYKGKYYFSLSYRWSNNAISAFNKNETINNESIIISSYVDGVKTNNFNFNAYIPVNITSWWSALNQLNINHSCYQAVMLPIFSAFSYDLFSQHTFYIPGNIRGEILYRYISRSKNGYSESYPYHLLNMAVYKSFFKDRLSVKVEAQRMLYNQKMGSRNETPSVIAQKQTYYSKLPFFAFTLSYSFSKGKAKKFQHIQSSNEQEKSRTN